MDIIFETQKGRQFTIEIGYFDSVLEIKEKVQKYQGIPVAKQTLVFNNQILPDEGDVASCVLLHNSRVQLFILPELEKPPQVKSEENNEPIPAVNRSHIQSVGLESQDHRPYEPVVDNVDIGVNNNVTRPSPTPSRSGSAGPMMGGGIGSSKKMRLKVLTSCGKIHVEVNPTDNVGELRKELERMQRSLNFQLSPQGYFFISNQNVMEETRSFRWNHVVPGDTIEIFNGSVTGGP